MHPSSVSIAPATVNPLPFAQVPYNLLFDQRLTGTALRLAGALLKYCQRSDRCWPSVATLTKVLGCCERTVQYALKRLKEAGWIRDEPAANPTGRVLVLTWREGGCKPPQKGGCKPYSQGLPVPREAPVAPQEDPEKKKVAPPRKTYKRATAAELTDLYQSWLEYPPGHPLRKMIVQRIAAASARAPDPPPNEPEAP